MQINDPSNQLPILAANLKTIAGAIADIVIPVGSSSAPADNGSSAAPAPAIPANIVAALSHLNDRMKDVAQGFNVVPFNVSNLVAPVAALQDAVNGLVSAVGNPSTP